MNGKLLFFILLYLRQTQKCQCTAIKTKWQTRNAVPLNEPRCMQWPQTLYLRISPLEAITPRIIAQKQFKLEGGFYPIVEEEEGWREGSRRKERVNVTGGGRKERGECKRGRGEGRMEDGGNWVRENLSFYLIPLLISPPSLSLNILSLIYRLLSLVLHLTSPLLLSLISLLLPFPLLQYMSYRSFLFMSFFRKILKKLESLFFTMVVHGLVWGESDDHPFFQRIHLPSVPSSFHPFLQNILALKS